MKVLITGGSGLLGSKLIPELLAQGHEVKNISRSGKAPEGAEGVSWPKAGEELDPAILDGVETIIHLAGAGVTDKRWSKERKQVIVDSRVKTLELIRKAYPRVQNKALKTLVSASGISYYGYIPDDESYSEEAAPTQDFLAKCCQDWETVAASFDELGVRRVSFRIGVVFTSRGGALPLLALPVKWGLGAAFGNGKQVVSWIHEADLLGMVREAIEDNSYQGIYNAVSPQAATNKEVNVALAKLFKRPLWLPAVPAFALQLAMGEMSQLVLGGLRIIPKRLEGKYQFRHPELNEALKDLYS